MKSKEVVHRPCVCEHVIVNGSEGTPQKAEQVMSQWGIIHFFTLKMYNYIYSFPT